MTVAVILTMGLVSRPNGGGKSWAENKDDAVALVRAIEEEAAKLVETSLAIDARLIAAATPRRGTASETIRSALKGARGLALDSGEADLDAELGRAIDLLDGLTARATPAPDTRLREALTSWYAADGESWRLVAIDRDGGIIAAGIPEALLDAIIRRATREETT